MRDSKQLRKTGKEKKEICKRSKQQQETQEGTMTISFLGYYQEISLGTRL